MAVTKPVHYYKFSGDADDIIGSANGTVSGCTLDSGKVAHGYYFDGSNDKITNQDLKTYFQDIKNTDKSWSAWIKRTTAKDCILMTTQSSDNKPAITTFWYRNSDGLTQVLIRDDAGNTAFIQGTAIFTMTPDVWYHITVTWNATSEEMKLYVNGSKVAEDLTTSLGSMTWSGGEEIEIGCTNQNGTTTAYGGQTISEYGLWDAELTSAEVTELYNSGTGLTFSKGADDFIDGTDSRFGQTVCYSYDNDFNDKIIGKSVNSVNSPTRVSGKIASALSLNGSSQYIQLDNNGSHPVSDFLDQDDDFTFSCWFKTTQTSRGNLISMGDDSSINSYVILDVSSSNGKVRFTIRDSSLNETSVSTTASTYADGEWHHAVGVKDGTASVKLYVDGVSASATGSTGNMATFESLTVGVLERQGTNRSGYFNGEMDEVTIHRRALSSSEVTDLYNSGTGKSYNQYSDTFVDGDSLKVGQTAYYKLDNSLVDSHGNTLISNNGATYTSSGLINGAYTFDGSNDYMTVDTNISTLPLSINFWCDTNSTSGNNYVVSLDKGSLWPYSVFGFGSQAGLRVQNGEVFGSGGTWGSGWKMFTMVLRANDDAELYKDGVSIATYTTSKTFSSSYDTLTIGTLSTGALADYFEGEVDEIGIWNRALTTTELSNLYNSGTGFQYPYVAATGYAKKIMGVSDYAKVVGILIDNITKVNGVE